VKSDFNLIPELIPIPHHLSKVCEKQVQPTPGDSTIWNHSTLHPVGDAILDVQNSKLNVSEHVKYVVQNNSISY